jgi:hypothetical protein
MHAVDNTFLETVPVAEGLVRQRDSDFELNIVILYQNQTDREWAMATWERVMQMVGDGGIRVVAWKISDLNQQGIFAGSLQDAARADVVMVAISAADRLPSELQLWVDAWLPHRERSTCALVAMVGSPETPFPLGAQTLEYLRAVADLGGLSFFPQQRRLPAVADQVPVRNTHSSETAPYR